MTTPKPDIVYSPRRQMRVNNIKLEEAKIDEFLALVGLAYVEKPAKEDLQEIRVFLKDYPEFCKAVFGLAESVQETLVRNMFDQEVPKIAMEEYTVILRNEFGYDKSPI